jgi:hypothetical protein
MVLSYVTDEKRSEQCKYVYIFVISNILTKKNCKNSHINFDMSVFLFVCSFAVCRNSRTAEKRIFQKFHTYWGVLLTRVPLVQFCFKSHKNNIVFTIKPTSFFPQISNVTKTNSVASVRKRTIPTERPPFVGDVSANFLTKAGTKRLREQKHESGARKSYDLRYI